MRVTEHQLIAQRCCCGTTTRAGAPEGVTAPVQYGPRITAIIVYLYVGQFLSTKRTAAALAELFGTPVSEGTVATMTTRAATRLGGFLEWVRTNLAAAAALAAAIHRYHSAALLGVEATRARDSKLMAKQHALARRLIDRQDDYLRFTVDPRIPFDNNAAEREVHGIHFFAALTMLAEGRPCLPIIA